MRSSVTSLTPAHVDLPYRGTTDTVARMLAIGKGQHGELSLPVRLWVEDVVRWIKPRDKGSQLVAIYNDFLRNWSYLYDPSEKEQVKTPERLVLEMAKYGRALGDCDDASLYLWAAPRTIGIRTDFVRAGFKRQLAGAPPSYSHIFTVAKDQHGRVIVLDPVAAERTGSMLRRVRHSVLGLGG